MLKRAALWFVVLLGTLASLFAGRRRWLLERAVRQALRALNKT